jgi:alkanesulfonate monooxygenase SsuD/methylene tetrahydromethanopterin reductase-like flavin-dependent oxidoreductase (luciferase family)
MTRDRFDASLGLRQHLMIGSPEQVIEKILFQHEVFRHDRYLAQLTVGRMPHRQTMRAIELLGTVVAPAVRKALG